MPATPRLASRIALTVATAMVTLMVTLAADAQEQTVTVDIPAQDAATALQELGRQTGLTILARAPDVRDVRTRAVTGTMPVRQAFARLLDGSGLGLKSMDGVSALVARLPAAPPAPSPATNARPAASTAAAPPEPIPEIIAVGIRRSLQQSIDRKRNAPFLLDAITAEDIGKLPDQNVVESLQRVAGAQITRAGGEGSDFTIRGITENQLAFNGVLLSGPSSDGSGRLREFNPESLDGIEVIKSPAADHTEGALGGTINLVSKKPLDLPERHLSFRLQGSYHDQADRPGAYGAVLLSARDDDRRLGVLFGVTAHDYHRNAQTINTDGWTRTNAAGTANTLDTNNDGVADAADQTDVYRPLRMVANMLWTHQKRQGYNTAVQLRPDSGLEIDFDAAITHSSTGIDSQRLQALLTDAAVDVEIGPTGTVERATYTEPTLRSAIYQEMIDTTQSVYALSARHDLDGWRMEGRVSYSRGNRREQVAVPLLGTMPGLTTTVTTDFTAGTDLPTFRLNQDYDGTDPANWRLLSNFETVDTTDNESGEAKLDVSRRLDSGWLSALKAGFRIERRDLGLTRRAQNPTDAEILAANPGMDRNGDGVIGTDELSGTRYDGLPADDFLSGHSGDIPRNWLGGSVDFAVERSGLGLGDPPILPASVRRARQTQTAAYAMADIDLSLAGMPVTGNAGLRGVRIDRTAGGFIVGEQTVYHDESRRFDHLLPSLNLMLEAAEDLVFRLAAARVVANPALAAVAPGTTLNVVRRTASRGNPALRPYNADQVDIATEWYFAPSGLLSATLFHKNIHSFIVNTTSQEWFDNGVNTGFYDVTQPANGRGGRLRGLETGYQQVFPDLPGILGGSGLSVNYTYARSHTPLTDPLTGRREAMPLLSRHSYNASLFLEQGWGTARLTYNWRSGFLETLQTAAAGGNLYARAYGQLDASMQVNIDENFRLNLDLLNIGKEPIRTYVGDRSRPRQYEVNDRRIMLGVSGRL